MKKILLFAFLYVLFFTYRFHFWDFELNWHAPVNASADVLFSVLCGVSIYTLHKKLSGKWMFIFSLLLIAVSSYFLFFFHKLVYLLSNMLTDGFQYMFHTICFQLLDTTTIVITGSLIYLLSRFSHDKTTIKKDIEKLEIEKNKEELKYLKTKINPEFIFNGLETIYNEIDKDENFAKEKIIQFSDILRYHLQYASLEKVDFNEEIKYLKSYIAFQYQSSTKLLDLNQKYLIDGTKTEIAPLLFVPLIENAFKFCGSGEKSKGKIDLQFECSKSLLKLEVSNTYNGADRINIPGNKLGISNVIRRLDLHYSGQYDLQIHDSVERSLYRCQLKIAI